MLTYPRKTLLISCLILFLSLLVAPASSQETGEEEWGNWLMFFGNEKLSDKYSFHHEAQLRLFESFGNFNQLLLRYGLNRHIDKNSIITAGYAYINTADFDKSDGDDRLIEHRIWEQFILRNEVGRIDFEHRYRLEQRWLSSDLGGNDYTNRARYRIYMAIPFNNKSLLPKTWYFAFYDEIFLNLNDNPFNQNRFYTALGYQLKGNLGLQAGYLRNKIGANEFNRVQFAIFLNTDL